MMINLRSQGLQAGKTSVGNGFSLLELLVAMAVFLTVSAVSFTLFGEYQGKLADEQVTVGLNIGLRNALSQIQIDVVNAGDGLILGTNVPSWPVGVTIQNSNPTATQCDPQSTTPPTYAAACFDTLNIVLADRTTPPLNPQTASGGSFTTDSAATITIYAPVPNVINPATNQPFTATTLAAKFNSGDEILFVKGCAGAARQGTPATINSSGCAFTTARLAAAGSASTATPPGANYIELTFNQTQTPGAYSPPAAPVVPYAGSNAVCSTALPNTCNDPLNMTSYATYTQLTDSFGTSDYIVRLAPITYSVNTSNVNDPQLVRSQSGTSNVLMDQVIGFKVGAALWNDLNTSTFQYNYDDANYLIAHDYALIRSVRVSMIGRTAPNPTNPYRNPFDNGQYQIRGDSIIVNPRNLTMNAD